MNDQDTPSSAPRRSVLKAVAGAALAGAGLTVAHAADAPGITDREIVLGGVFALSGPTRFVTEPYEQAIRSYFNKVNAAGGVNGRQITWKVEDDGYQPARTLAAAKKLIDRDNVFLLFGQLGTPTALAVAPYADQVKVPFFILTASPEPQYKYTFGLMANYADLMYQATMYAARSGNAKRIGYFYQNDDLGASGRRGVDRALKELGLALAADVGYERGTNDFGTHVLKLKDADIDTVISMSTAPSTATAMKQAMAVDYTPRWMTYNVGNSAVMEKLVGDKIDGMTFSSEIDTSYSDSAAAKEVNALMAKDYPGAKIDSNALLGYAHARLIVAVLQAAGRSPTRESVVAILNRPEGFEVGIMPPIRYSATKHTGASNVRIYQWQGGKPLPKSNWLPIAAP